MAFYVASVRSLKQVPFGSEVVAQASARRNHHLLVQAQVVHLQVPVQVQVVHWRVGWRLGVRTKTGETKLLRLLHILLLLQLAIDVRDVDEQMMIEELISMGFPFVWKQQEAIWIDSSRSFGI